MTTEGIFFAILRGLFRSATLLITLAPLVLVKRVFRRIRDTVPALADKPNIPIASVVNTIQHPWLPFLPLVNGLVDLIRTSLGIFPSEITPWGISHS
jgi:uncharacterized membrane protein